jgi:hypothetical protein
LVVEELPVGEAVPGEAEGEIDGDMDDDFVA